jgi:leucine-rich PPR motif-containing protein
MVAKGIEPDRTTYFELIDAHCKEGNLIEALRLRDEISKKGIPMNLAAYDGLIQALCTKEEFSEALTLLDEMGERGLGLSFATCRTIICGCQRVGNMEKAAKVLERMLWCG